MERSVLDIGRPGPMHRPPRRAGVLMVAVVLLLGFGVVPGPDSNGLAHASPVSGTPIKPPDARYEDLRRAIRAAPADADDSLDSLARFLGGLASDERGRAYAVFYWIAQNIAYDDDGFFNGDFGDLTPESVLNRREAVCSGYARLFKALATRLGLAVEEVSGLAKGYTWAHAGTLGEHAWNAVRIDGQWQLIDATWGAGHIGRQQRFERELNEFYFLSPPAHLIYSHLPNDPRWQLLPTPVTRAQFEALPELEPAFFAYGFSLIGQPKPLLSAGSALTLEFTAPAEVFASADLFQGDQELSEHLSMVERAGTRLRVHAQFPAAGRYSLRVFGRQGGAEGSYEPVARFDVEAAAGVGDQAGFPELSGAYQRSGASALEPLRAVVPAGQPARFSVTVPGAAKVAVVDSAGTFNPLVRSGEQFEGAVVLPPGEVRLMADLEPFDNTYAMLARYQAR